ncbi:MAG: hypothetical protein ACO3MG_11470 [Saprospiraceae bacterium]
MAKSIPNKIEQALITVIQAAEDEAQTQEFEEQFDVVKKILDACDILEHYFDL